jgi:hypothetical protein
MRRSIMARHLARPQTTKLLPKRPLAARSFASLQVLAHACEPDRAAADDLKTQSENLSNFAHGPFCPCVIGTLLGKPKTTGSRIAARTTERP